MCTFNGSDSWVILTPIEQSIKHKIESVGTPLRDWDINIYRGVLTGYNEAFIIDTAKREEILANCKSEKERKRTAELIRPILRGRDIKRYGYDWAGLWLINTHNGVKGKYPPIDIKDYPAVKKHLDSYWDKIEKRDDKGVTPYNLRNCAYMDFFFNPNPSIELLPNGKTAVAFVPDSSTVFREDTRLDVRTLPNGMKFIPWGTDNMMPYNIISKIEDDETLATCQQFNAEVCYGARLRYNADQCKPQVQNNIDEFFMNNDLATYFLGVCQDLKYFAFAVTVIIFNY